ncbi:CLUMA_CG011364, isoform A [Clunio marinus]|uniref:CLUMA_CG011364, isoform A n=1 Tax=Clunio marinus TaxID=568069 RepID=A0A1J1ICR6_9DIPT|nr:CLUMA_CG011364, isoform A [Clunio marinus]
MDEKTKNNQIQQFKSWIDQEKLLKEIDDILLERYLKVYDNLEKAQDLLKFNLTLRKSGPHLFTNRDVLSSEFQSAKRTFQFCPLPKLTSENHKVTIIRLVDLDHNVFDYVQTVKMVLMCFDVRFIMYDDYDKTIASGERFVIDTTGLSFRHFLKIATNISTVRLYMRFLQEAIPFNIKQLHFISSSSVFDKMFSLLRPFLKKELIEIMNIHTEGIQSLHKHFDKDVLPSEYGGDLGPIKDIHEVFMEKVLAKRDYVINDDNWKMLN